MLVLRVGRLSRWNNRDFRNPQHVEDAARDMDLAPDEEGLSVFTVADEGEEQQVAVRFAMTCRNRPDHLDYVTFPAELASDLGLDVRHVPRPELDDYLTARHFEIVGLTVGLGQQLARAILENRSYRVHRIRDRDLTALGAALCREHPRLRDHLRGSWPGLMAKLLDQTQSGSG